MVGGVPLRKYQGFWIWDFTLSGIMTAAHHFKARPGDLFIATPIKSGTTWLRALTFATMTRKDYPLSNHPLLSMSPHDCFPLLEARYTTGQASEIYALPSPRLLGTDLPYSLLPESVTSSDCSIVYLCRNPKDTLVSAWHFTQESTVEMEPFSFSKAFEMFCAGIFPNGPLWDHCLEYWKESLRRPDKVLFLKYEEMMEEPARNLRRLAEFIGYPFTEEEEKDGVVEEIVRLCSFQVLSNLEVNKTRRSNRRGPWNIENAFYFRKGKVGDWENYLTAEMAQKLDDITQQKLHGSALSLADIGSRGPTGDPLSTLSSNVAAPTTVGCRNKGEGICSNTYKNHLV